MAQHLSVLYFYENKGEAIFLWTQHFNRWRFSCLVMREFQFAELCGLWQIAVSWMMSFFTLYRYPYIIYVKLNTGDYKTVTESA